MGEFTPYVYKRYPTGLKYPFVYPQVPKKEYLRRWREIRKSMNKHNIDLLILKGDLAHGNYLNYIANYYCYDLSSIFLAFPLNGQPLISVPTELGPQFMHVASETSLIDEVIGSQDQLQDLVKKVKELNLEKGRIGVVGYAGMWFPAALYEDLRKTLPKASIKEGTEVLCEAMDRVSRVSKEELTMLRKATQLCDFSFNAVRKVAKPGLREYELWAVAAHAIVANGGAFPPSIYATSAQRPLFPRGPPSHNTLVKGDVMIFEVTSNYGGCMPQTCYALSLGPPAKDIQEMFDFCSELYEFTLKEMEKKRTYGVIETELAERIHAAGYEPMTPQVHRFCMSGRMPMKQQPKPGDYVTVHPNFCNKSYTSGAKFGDEVRIRKDGKVERLMKTSAKLHIIS